ncbi:MAG TPA: alpha/beta hydrolase [Opitutales bacterium]|jgi:acetyl esterase/lipase|nr:alpha/beta hydrolase [Opitutales bacterium]
MTYLRANFRIAAFLGAALAVAGVFTNGAQAQSRGAAGNGEAQAAYAEQLKNTPDPVPGIPAPVLLWPAGAPEAVPDANGVFTDEDKPALYCFPAPADHNTGTAFLIIPGGAFTNRVADGEGVQVARFLNAHGISGFVLRYRILPNYRNNISVLDANRAMRYLRAHAAEFKIRPDRLGSIGFSAGAELEGDAFFNGVVPGDANAADPLDHFSTRPNFIALIYGARTPRDASTAPPTFMFNTVEDSSHLNVEVAAWNALRAANIPTEVHFYNYGEHGTSMSPGDPLLGEWPELMISWLKASGLLEDQKPAVPPVTAKPSP